MEAYKVHTEEVPGISLLYIYFMCISILLSGRNPIGILERHLTAYYSCQAGLKNGHVSCASLLVGDLGTWQGLLTLGGSSFGGLRAAK